ncbi:hypothetical protein HYX58_02485 [Candidatus Dependentiae bacterium]|nr:hypothetical protein [Candidatus Dependentiae bacterium]
MKTQLLFLLSFSLQNHAMEDVNKPMTVEEELSYLSNQVKNIDDVPFYAAKIIEKLHAQPLINRNFTKEKIHDEKQLFPRSNDLFIYAILKKLNKNTSARKFDLEFGWGLTMKIQNPEESIDFKELLESYEKIIKKVKTGLTIHPGTSSTFLSKKPAFKGEGKLLALICYRLNIGINFPMTDWAGCKIEPEMFCVTVQTEDLSDIKKKLGLA